MPHQQDETGEVPGQADGTQGLVDETGLLLEAEADPEGNHKQVAWQYAANPIFTLPAGQYLVRVTREGKTASEELSIEAGVSAEMVVVLE